MKRLTFRTHAPRGSGGRLGRILSLAAALALGVPAHATDLLQAWQAAQAHDPELAAAQQALAAGQARIEQGKSLWRPTLEARASAGYGTQESRSRGAEFAAPGFGSAREVEFNTSVRGGTQTEYGIHLRQPLIDPARHAAQSQLRHSAAQAEAAWQAASQQAMLRTAERYFEVLLARDGLRVLERQQRTVSETLERAQARFQAGDSSILDVHEARARLDQLDAQRLLAQVQLELAQAAFQDITGLPGHGLAALPANGNAGLASPPGEPLQDWLAQAANASPDIRQSQEAAAMASDEADKHRAIAAPTLELIGSAGRSHLSGTGEYGPAAQSANQWSAGLQLRIPLYSGGMRGARYHEALALRDQARLQTQAAGQRIAQSVRAAWLSLDTARARIRALTQAIEATAARRDATRLGLEVGERDTLDWLDAEDAVARADLALRQALSDVVLDRLRLHALAGRLDIDVLESANCALEGAPCP
ncbi:TolC family outer membrane protein [Castellaniella sp. GW247-6E4]|uniref:TolC family outer membrane protein n=1 Tax=Castellaniella sp. GW247-6E4 TaxID=3140380 RepID=UPI00331520BD